MDVVEARSFARAGFLGNPSDGYFGKTVSFTFTEFFVDLKLAESSRLRFVPGEVDDATFSSPEALVRDLRLYGYYGGIRMLKAVSKLFFEYCMDHGIDLPKRNFTAEYKINIPRLVGLSGSSAICSAMLKALMKFYGVEIPLEECPTICLEAERDELGIACGLQDRVIQMYNGMVYMDFERSLVEKTGHGRYERLFPGGGVDPDRLGLYIAYDPARAEESGKAHKKVKRLFEQKNSDVVSAMKDFASIAEAGRSALLKGDTAELGRLVNANFDLRDRIFNVAEENRRMVMTARAAGASAKFAGSGGAITGLCEDGEMFDRLVAKLGETGCRVIRPKIATAADEQAALAASGWRNS
ncbi:MAG: GHMP kinase [Kiritimatiellae bacterium]|nr:GHMP kinase [Kiritimatiellia bacterium]